VAAATLISEVGAAGVGAIIILRAHRALGGRWRGGAFERTRLVAMMRVNVDIFVRTLCLIFAFAWFTAQGARISDTVLAANAVLYNMFMLVAYGLDAFAFAAEALVGAAIGRGDRAAYRAAIRLTTAWAAMVSVLFALLFAVGGWLVIEVMTSIPSVRAAARGYLVWAVAVPLVGVWSFQLDGIFIGATRTAEMRNGMIISLAGFLAGGYLLLDLWRNDGLWAALLLFLALRALTLAAWLPRIGRELASRAAAAACPP
jgi:MATE family multidrug resistance protein